VTDIDIDHLRTWIGRREVRREVVAETLVERFHATIPDGLWDGAPTPLGLIWCLGLPALPLDGLGPDGHPARGGFLPPVPLVSRMWAGGELRHHGHIRVGEEVVHIARIADVVAKAGRSGPLVFVTVAHDYLVHGRLIVTERQDIVYRDPTPGSLPAAIETARPEGEGWMSSGPVQMFRYSALTFNGHRIHYDLDHARNVEGYPGLVVHGPLQATLLLNRVASRLGAVPARFAFRGLAPLFSGEAFRLREEEGAVWCEKASGTVTMKAEFEA
jgi:Uncharacterized conserved protein